MALRRHETERRRACGEWQDGAVSDRNTDEVRARWASGRNCDGGDFAMGRAQACYLQKVKKGDMRKDSDMKNESDMREEGYMRKNGDMSKDGTGSTRSAGWCLKEETFDLQNKSL